MSAVLPTSSNPLVHGPVRRPRQRAALREPGGHDEGRRPAHVRVAGSPQGPHSTANVRRPRPARVILDVTLGSAHALLGRPSRTDLLAVTGPKHAATSNRHCKLTNSHFGTAGIRLLTRQPVATRRRPP